MDYIMYNELLSYIVELQLFLKTYRKSIYGKFCSDSCICEYEEEFIFLASLEEIILNIEYLVKSLVPPDDD